MNFPMFQSIPTSVDNTFTVSEVSFIADLLQHVYAIRNADQDEVLADFILALESGNDISIVEDEDE